MINNREFELQKRRDMSNFLMYRYLYDGKSAYPFKSVRLVDLSFNRTPVRNAYDLVDSLESQIRAATRDGKAAIALSGGIDSAIMAKLMPEGSTAYTFRCVVPGRQVIDETAQAAKYARECGLKHEIIDITWADIIKVINKLIEHKGAPIHSIEAQIYLASCKAKSSGFTKLILGENADIIYGGMNGLLAEDWLTGEFIERYSYVLPYRVMYNPNMDFAPFYKYDRDGHIDGHEFINEFFRQEALGTYTNACGTAGIEFIGPYSKTVMAVPIDYKRIRSGDTKYIVREAFRMMYPGWDMPSKIPMPRPMNEWMAEWNGPTRTEFIPHCADKLTGDQKWMVYVLERYLNYMDEKYGNQ